MAKRTRIPKGAKGLAIPRGGCRVVEGYIKVCVSKKGAVSIKQSRGPGIRKRKAGPKRKKPAARRKAPVRGKARCATPPFKLRVKRGVRCACGVKNRRGTLVPRFLPMADPRCSGRLPGPMTWKTYAGKGAPMVRVSGIGRRRARRRVPRRRRY